MNIEELRTYCLSLPATSEDMPFDESALVFRVGRKIFAFTDLEGPFYVNLKCDPERALLLREEFDGKIFGAFHMSKTHWNSVMPDSLPPALVKDLIDHSYALVVKGLTKKQQQVLNESSQ